MRSPSTQTSHGKNASVEEIRRSISISVGTSVSNEVAV